MAVSTMDRTKPLVGRQSLPLLALSTLISTILLVAMGSIVRVTGYGLGCPDWPLCYGRVIPPALTGAWMEFTHRLIGAATSLQIVLLGVLAWRRYRNRPWIFRPAVAAVGLLVIQAVLGGLHVIFEIPPLTGWIHTALAMLIVGLVAIPLAHASPALPAIRGRGEEASPSRAFVAWVSGTAVATYLLLLTGSYVTRSGASLACPSFPLCGVPVENSLTLIQMLHRYVAFGVAFLALVLVAWLVIGQTDRRLGRLAYGLGALLLVQFGLGIANVLLRLPMWTRVLHLTVAAAFWAGVVLIWSLCWAPDKG